MNFWYHKIKFQNTARENVWMVFIESVCDAIHYISTVGYEVLVVLLNKVLDACLFSFHMSEPSNSVASAIYIATRRLQVLDLRTPLQACSLALGLKIGTPGTIAEWGLGDSLHCP